MSVTIKLKRGTTEPTSGSLVAGELAINTGDGNVYTKLDDGSVSNIVGKSQKLTASVRNESGSTIPAFSVVYISGASNNKPLISLAQANSEATSSKTFGVTTASISNNQNGEVVVSGLLEKVDTQSYTAGQQLWLSSTTAGGLATTPPTAPNHSVFIGTVVASSANQGKVEVKIQNGYELGELHNISISSPSDGDVLTYNSSTGLWGNEAPSGGGGGAAAIPAYDNGVTYTVGQQVIFSNRFWYMSTAVGGAGYDPIGYPAYWTEISASGGGGGGGTWGSITGTVTDQTDLTTYISGELADYLPLAGGTMTGAINFGTGGQNIDVGTFDSGRYGSNGISLKCAVGFELNWQAGWLTGNQFLGSPSIVPIYIDSGAGSTLKVWEGTTSTGVTISHTGITFPDSTTQTTAGIADAPSDGSNYGRLNGAWAATLPDAPSDGTQYVRQNGSWQVNSGFTHSDSPNDGNMYARAGSSLGWVQIGTGTDAIATQNYVTSQGYATTGDVSTAVSGLVTASNARKQALVEAFRAALDDSGKTYDFSGYLNYPFKSGAFNTCVTNGEFSSTGKWFGIMEPVASSFISPATFVQLSGSVVTISFAYANGATGTGLYYTEDGGTTWVESTFKI